MDESGRMALTINVIGGPNRIHCPFWARRIRDTVKPMSQFPKATSSARERARKANAHRLADARERLKNQEADLVSYFDATHDEDKIEDDLAGRIDKLRSAARVKLEDARGRRASALAALKARGETYSAVARLVDLPVAEATKLIRSTRREPVPSGGAVDKQSAAPRPDAGEDSADPATTAQDSALPSDDDDTSASGRDVA